MNDVGGLKASQELGNKNGEEVELEPPPQHRKAHPPVVQTYEAELCSRQCLFYPTMFTCAITSNFTVASQTRIEQQLLRAEFRSHTC